MRTTPVCIHCSLPMTNISVGATIISMYMDPPQPCKLWRTDIYKCPQCSNEVAAGYGTPTPKHLPEFDEYLEEIWDTLKTPYGVSDNDIIIEYEKATDSILYGSNSRSRSYLLGLLNKRFSKKEEPN